MKETTKMSRAIGQLEKMYRQINIDLFENKLPEVIITVQSSPKAMGSSSCRKIWRSKEDWKYEINISAEVLNFVIEETLDTLIHEMVHIYCRENDIKETSRGTAYHNSRFKAEAEKRLLVCEKCGNAGWNTIGANNDKLTAYAMEKGWSEIQINRLPLLIPTGQQTAEQQTAGQQQTAEGKKSSTRKLKCPRCGMIARTTKQAGKLICGNCYEETGEIHMMEEVEK